MTLPTLAVRIGKGCKANVAWLKIYTKRAGEDETSGPTDEGTNSDGSVASFPGHSPQRVHSSGGSGLGTRLMEVESQSQEDPSQTLNVVEHQNPRHFPSKEECKFLFDCYIQTIL